VPKPTRQAARAELAETSAPMPGQLKMVEAIRDAVPNAIIVGDSTQPVYAANLYYDHDRPRGWFNAATGYGALGFGPGAAVGAAIAAPGVPVVCLIGDGGLQFSPGELRTAVDENLPITYVVWNNSGFREIAEAMREAKTPVLGCDPSPLTYGAFRPWPAICPSPRAAGPCLLREMLATPQDGPASGNSGPLTRHNRGQHEDHAHQARRQRQRPRRPKLPAMMPSSGGPKK
jgi:acetolactate synthase-1/2/3 large subunit